MIVVVLCDPFSLSCVLSDGSLSMGGYSIRSIFYVDSVLINVYHRQDGLYFRTVSGRGGVGVLMGDIVLNFCVVCLE